VEPHKYLHGADAETAFEDSAGVAESQGKPVYDELVELHGRRIASEKKNGEHAFQARRRMTEKIGLAAVRDHRLRQLEQEYSTWQGRMQEKTRIIPDMAPIMILRVERQDSHA